MATDGIGSKIRLRRQQLRLTQAQLADRIGVHVSTVTSWEKGRHFPARYQGAVEAELGITLTAEPEPEIYTDPTERQIWEDPTLPEGQRREFIRQLRQARADHASRQHRPSA